MVFIGAGLSMKAIPFFLFPIIQIFYLVLQFKYLPYEKRISYHIVIVHFNSLG